MLLSAMRKHAKSWLIKFLIAIIAVVFIFYFGYSFTSEEGVKIAYVNGEVIGGIEYQKAYYDLKEALRRQYQNVWNDNLIKVFNLKRRALDNLINEKLISQEARRMGLDVTEDEVQKAIMDYPAFQTNGRFDIGRYRALLGNNRMKPEDFEADMSRELLEGKLKQFLFTFMEVPDQEVLDHYTFSNEGIKISFVQFKPDKFKKSIKTDQDSMAEFFKEHKEDYRIPEKIKIAYLVIDPDTFRDKVKVKDEEISGYYEYHIDAFSQTRQVRARHILFKLSQDAPGVEEKKVRAKAEAVLEEARQNKDFAALAGKYSEGPTKSKGGDLGYFSAGQMIKPFEEVAFKLKKGEISDLVRTPFGYHIIKVEDVKEARTKTLDEVRDQIVDILINDTSTELAYEKGLSLMDQMPYDVDLAQYGAQHELKVKHTDYFSKDEPIPGIEGNEKLGQSLFSLEKGETSELIELKGKFYIFQVADKKPSYLPEMKDVAGKLKEDFAAHLAIQEARSAAESCLAELQKGKAWDELVKERNLEPEETDFFTRKDPVPKIGYEKDLQEAAFKLNRDKRYPDRVFKNDKGVFVIRWEEDKGIDETKYLEEKEKYRFALMQAKHTRAFENWLESLRKHADIEIVTPVDET